MKKIFYAIVIVSLSYYTYKKLKHIYKQATDFSDLDFSEVFEQK